MSSQGARRRCIIQKLDFENCIITNIKTTARGRKKLRARITREIEKLPVDVEEQEPSSSQTNQGSTSPVLIKRQCRDCESPVFTKRKKISFPEENVEKLSGESTTTEEVNSSPGSPVFKMSKRPKTSNPKQTTQNVLRGMSSLDLFSSQGNSGSSIQIDEFTQESKTSFKISSFESSEVKNDSVSSIDSDAVGLNTSCRGESSGERLSNTFGAPDTSKSFRRNYKKNSLLGRLKKLQQKRASEKLLWQHQNRKSSSSLKFSVVNFWQEEFYYIFKCRSLPDSETNFLIVDSRWVPNVKSVAEGSVLRVHPPWQKLQVDESSTKVLLNVICLDVLEETEEPVLQKRTFESVPKNQFETAQKLFIDSLFSVGSELFW